MIYTTCRKQMESAETGLGNFEIAHLYQALPTNIVTIAIVTIAPGEEIGYHRHESDNELYYILSGQAEYNDNGAISTITEGAATCTCRGQSHSIKNIGAETLRFFAIIVK